MREEESHENIDCNLFTVGGVSSSEQAYATRCLTLVAFARRCASCFRFASASPYARHVVSVGRQGRSLPLRWVGGKVGGRRCGCDEGIEGPKQDGSGCAAGPRIID